jgi:hypothetical protein
MRDGLLFFVMGVGIAIGCSSNTAATASGLSTCSALDATPGDPVKIAQLPNGTCAATDHQCLVTQDVCPDGVENGPLIAWECSCGGGVWNCVKTGQSLSVCDSLDGGNTSLGDAATGDQSCAVPNPTPGGPVRMTELPQGACSVGGQSCTLITQDLCPGGIENGPQIAWKCMCGGGTWSCAQTGESLSVCDPLDGGGS